MHPEIDALNYYRLRNNYTWAKLAEEMAEAGVEMSPRTLHYVLKRLNHDATPRDTTLFKIRLFLKLRNITVSAEDTALLASA